MLIIKGLAGAAVQLLLLGSALIVPAALLTGDWGWKPGWQYMGIYAVLLITSTVAMGIFAPASLEARLQPTMSDTQAADDKRATLVLLTVLFASMILMPLDGVLWQLLGRPSETVSLAGLVISVLGFALIVWVLFANAFAIPNVADQSDRGQVVVETGPYAIVRHPMYLGIIPWFAGLGLWLQSTASLLLLVPLLGALALRIRAEERVLMQSLDGYQDFTRRRRYRLLPYVW